jgi:spoIIIJ-associated protein
VAVKEATVSPRREDEAMAEGMTLQEQGEIGKGFLEGLTAAFGLPATVQVRVIDDETVELAVDGSDLGILVGPRGATLAALQEVTRTAVQAKCPSRTDRILVDVARYRERRSAALTEFTATLAAEVVATGEERQLEPMSPADRKVVHDAATAIDGVATRSEGEDPDRFVVISPA